MTHFIDGLDVPAEKRVVLATVDSVKRLRFVTGQNKSRVCIDIVARFKPENVSAADQMLWEELQAFLDNEINGVWVIKEAELNG